MIWSDLYHYILPHLPGCPEPLVDDTLRRVAITFCQRTHLWEEQLQDLYPVVGITRYQITPPEETDIISLSYCATKAAPIPVANWPEINPFGLLKFDNAPDPKDGPLEIKAILKPDTTATGMPDQIGLYYQEGLVNGALGILQAMPHKDWTNPQLAVHHASLFDEAIREARFRRANNNTERTMRVKPRHLL